MTSLGVIVAVEISWSMRTTCIARETGAMSTLGTALAESRHGPSSSGEAAIGGAAPGGGACATVEASAVRKNIANANMLADFAPRASASFAMGSRVR